MAIPVMDGYMWLVMMERQLYYTVALVSSNWKKNVCVTECITGLSQFSIIRQLANRSLVLVPISYRL